MKDSTAIVKMNEERKAEIRAMIIQKSATQKRVRKLCMISIATVLAASVIVLIIPYTRENIVNAATKLTKFFTANGKPYEVTSNELTGEEEYIFPTFWHGLGKELAIAKDGRLYMVVGNELIDVTDYCSATSYYRYERDNGNGTTEVIIVGGIPEDNKYGWIDLLYDSKGERLSRVEHMPCTESSQAPWTNEDFEWAVIARHDEGIPCMDPDCHICN